MKFRTCWHYWSFGMAAFLVASVGLAGTDIDPGSADPFFGINRGKVQGEIHGGVGTSESGVVYGVGGALSGKVGEWPDEANNDSVGSVELYMGKPFLRIKGSTDLFPINIAATAGQWGSWGYVTSGHVFLVNFYPITAEGQYTLNQLANEVPGPSHITVAPEVALKYLGFGNTDLGALILTVEARGGVAGVRAEDQNGEGAAIGPRFTGKINLILANDGLHVGANVGGRLIPEVAGNLATSYEGVAGLRGSVLLNSGQELFVGAEGSLQSFQVMPVPSDTVKGAFLETPNTKVQLTEDSLYLGGTVGINF